MSTNKPAWLKDAVATTVGWVNPRTNEILVSRRNLPDALPYVHGKIVWPKKSTEAPQTNTTQSKSEQKRKVIPETTDEFVKAPAIDTPTTGVQKTKK